ncbi:MAG: PPC domain-containing DNA-binding protein [Deltaproteobacteria bacterium]
MKYTSGKLGRVFVLRFEDGDVLLKELASFCARKKVRTAVCFFIGALKDGDLAAGPKKPVVPPEPNWVPFRGGWETMAIATVFTGRRGPQVHVHSSMGKKERVLTGCVRKDSNVFLVLEAVVFEITGVKASKDIDPRTGLNLLRVG